MENHTLKMYLNDLNYSNFNEKKCFSGKCIDQNFQGKDQYQRGGGFHRKWVKGPIFFPRWYLMSLIMFFCEENFLREFFARDIQNYREHIQRRQSREYIF